MIIPFIKLSKDAIVPQKAYEFDAAFDLSIIKDQEWTGETYPLGPNQRKVFCTGIGMAIPKGFCGVIKDRSGLALKNGITILGGIIDSSYRGEIKIIALNTSQETKVFSYGNKAAQMLILPVPYVEFIQIDNLDTTERGEKGFNSTGE